MKKLFLALVLLASPAWAITPEESVQQTIDQMFMERLNADESELHNQRDEFTHQLEVQQKQIAELKEEVQNQHRLIDHPYP